MERGNIFRFISHEDLPHPARVGARLRHRYSKNYITCQVPAQRHWSRWFRRWPWRSRRRRLGFRLRRVSDLYYSHVTSMGRRAASYCDRTAARVSCSASCAFSVQNSGKIRTANFDLANTEGVGAKVYFPNPRIGTASPFSVGVFLKVLAFDFRSKGVFRRSWLLWLRMRKVGRHDHSKTSADHISFE
jgi:hypothetical protein